MLKRPEILGIDLFAGAGGLSLGAQMAGIRITHAIENSAAAAATYRANHAETNLIEKDIRSVAPIRRKPGAVNILFGGPPCQGFSTSNQRTRTASNPRNWLFNEFFRFARFGNPDWIVLENVRGLRHTARGQFEKMILEEFKALGYSAAVWTLCAADYGVPQKRDRLFFVARRRGPLPPVPAPVTKAPFTVREAIADLPRLSVGASRGALEYRDLTLSGYAKAMRQGLSRCTGHLVTRNNDLVLERYRHIPQGGNWTDIPRRLMRNYTNLIDDRSRHTGIYRRLRWDEPSVVIGNYRKNMLIHPEQDRGLSVREAARLQSFPDRYAFMGSIGLQQQQVGNAVPPLLAKAVFSVIVAAS